MNTALKIFLVIDIILVALAAFTSLMPPRLPSEAKTVGVVTHDTVVRVNQREQLQPERISESPAMVVQPKRTSNRIEEVGAFASSSPFYQEAAKILSGRLTEDDANNRRMILNYCEHLRTAYTAKDIDFIRQVFSEKALIIVGHVVKERATDASISMDCPKEKVQYFAYSKQKYVSHLSQVFKSNNSIDVTFSDFHILRHPTIAGIYGVTLRQAYKSDRYSDDGRLFLLWDFRNPSLPLIHVRVWQYSASLHGSDDIIGLSDFNLE